MLEKIDVIYLYKIYKNGEQYFNEREWAKKSIFRNL